MKWAGRQLKFTLTPCPPPSRKSHSAFIVPHSFKARYKCSKCGTEAQEVGLRGCFPVADQQLSEIQLTVLARVASNGDTLQGFLSTTALCRHFGISEDEKSLNSLYRREA